MSPETQSFLFLRENLQEFMITQDQLTNPLYMKRFAKWKR